MGIITKVEGDRKIMEINGKPALEVYSEWVGTPVDKLKGMDLLVASIPKPLGIKDIQGDLTAIRHPMAGNDDLSISVGAKVVPNTAVIQMESTIDEMIDTINRSLEKSYAIINNIVGNDKIMNFQIIQNNISDSTIEVNGSTSIIGDLSDPISREKVRYVMRELLNDVDTLVESKEVEEVHEVEKDDTET